MARKCPYCGSEELGFINICGLTFAVACKDCGMSGPVQHTEEEAVTAFDSLCAKMCTHCISRTWGRKLRDKLKEVSIHMQESKSIPELFYEVPSNLTEKSFILDLYEHGALRSTTGLYLKDTAVFRAKKWVRYSHREAVVWNPFSKDEKDYCEFSSK